MSETLYGPLDRLLHHLAMRAFVAETAFEVDQSTLEPVSPGMILQPHVFISGLARAGTTVLMRRLHATGMYRSLTYKDMPFVLAPNLWRRIAFNSRAVSKAKERMHGDGILVNSDSPECFDEVFWRTFLGGEYIRETYLQDHDPSQEDTDKFVRYVNAVLAAQPAPRRKLYLSKNNNNILRLHAIRRAFPNALLMVPFREPLQHAHSLLRQHRRFCELQAQDKFTLSYMNWLGHYEFGLGHRPMRLGGMALPYGSEGSLDYWLRTWCNVYSWLESSAPKSVIFVCYEDLCSNEKLIDVLMRKAGVSGDESMDRSGTFNLRKRTIDDAFDDNIVAQALEIYTKLALRARQALSNHEG